MGHFFVTGASGQLGSSLVRYLTQQGHQCTILMRPTSYHPILDNLNVDTIIGCIEDSSSYSSILDHVDGVFHCAGVVSYAKKDDSKMITCHQDGTKAILDACLKKNTPKVIVVSSTASLGIPKPTTIATETHPFPEDQTHITYLRSKAWVNEYAHHMATQGLNVVIAAPSTLLGQGDYHGNTRLFYDQVQKQSIIAAPPGRLAVLSINDCIRGLWALYDKGRPGEVYILSHSTQSYLDIYHTYAQLLSKSIRVIRLPQWLKWPLKWMGSIIQTLVPRSDISPSLIDVAWSDRLYESDKVQKDCGWRAEDSLYTMLQAAIKYYQ